MPKLDPFKGARVPVTRADEKLLRGDSPQRRRFVISNLRRLATFMDKLPLHYHEQGEFATIDGEHTCGTRGCGLGWAALAHLAPGLQYDFYGKKPGDSTKPYTIVPMVNGERVEDWDEVGEQFYGPTAMQDIFWQADTDKEELVSQLRQRAAEVAHGEDL